MKAVVEYKFSILANLFCWYKCIKSYWRELRRWYAQLFNYRELITNKMCRAWNIVLNFVQIKLRNTTSYPIICKINFNLLYRITLYRSLPMMISLWYSHPLSPLLWPLKLPRNRSASILTAEPSSMFYLGLHFKAPISSLLNKRVYLVSSVSASTPTLMSKVHC